MEKKELLGGLSIISLVAILFSPNDSNLWIYFLILGIIFGIGWYKSN